MATNSTKLTIEMPKKEHQKLKAMAAALGLTIKDLVLNCLRDNVLYSQNRPNNNTLKVFHDTDSGKNLKSFKSADEFLKDLGIDN